MYKVLYSPLKSRYRTFPISQEFLHAFCSQSSSCYFLLTTDLISVHLVLPFPACHKNEDVIKWKPFVSGFSGSVMLLQLIHVVAFFFSRILIHNINPVIHSTYIPQFIFHQLVDISVFSSFWLLRVKLLWMPLDGSLCGYLSVDFFQVNTLEYRIIWQ